MDASDVIAFCFAELYSLIAPRPKQREGKERIDYVTSRRGILRR